MNSDVQTLAREYIEAVGNKQFDILPQFFRSDIEFSSPDLKSLNGADDYISALRRLGTILLRNEVRKVFSDGNEACIIYDFVTDTPVGAVPSVEWLKIEDGRIKSVLLIFHSLNWPQVRDEAIRRAQNPSI